MFSYTFKITNKIIFEVNNEKYFATSAALFNHTNTDFNECGQCQHILPKGAARSFYEKWDPLHLTELKTDQEKDIMQDIEELKTRYAWIPSCNFREQQALIRSK